MSFDKIKQKYTNVFLHEKEQLYFGALVNLDLQIKCCGEAIYTRPARLSYNSYTGDNRSKSLWEHLKSPFTKTRYISGSKYIRLGFESIKIPILSYDQHIKLSNAFEVSKSLADLIKTKEFFQAIESLGSVSSDEYYSIPDYTDHNQCNTPWLYNHDVDYLEAQGLIWSDWLIDDWIEKTIDENLVELNKMQQDWTQKELIKWLQKQFPKAEKIPSKRSFDYFITKNYFDNKGNKLTEELMDRFLSIDKPISGFGRDGAEYRMEPQFEGLKLESDSVSIFLDKKKVSFDDLKACYEFIGNENNEFHSEEHTEEAKTKETKSYISLFHNRWVRTGLGLVSFIAIHTAMNWEEIPFGLGLSLLMVVIISTFLMRVFLPTACAILAVGGIVGSFGHFIEFEILSGIGNLIFGLVFCLWALYSMLDD